MHVASKHHQSYWDFELFPFLILFSDCKCYALLILISARLQWKSSLIQRLRPLSYSDAPQSLQAALQRCLSGADTKWLDIRGNHDTFDVKGHDAEKNYFNRFSVMGTTHQRSYSAKVNFANRYLKSYIFIFQFTVKSFNINQVNFGCSRSSEKKFCSI